ncbi:MAG: bifunctional folylpolyglutamate synthase/dihydrofolate synthase [Spirochaetaceae bacterium]|nr:bifunctional folylpolyglutamate synthase/dihydrofolate synthase [Spirochaetaceae bacterium]
MPHTAFNSSDEIFDFLMGYVNVEKGQKTEFKLDRMRWLAEKLGNPHKGRLTIHVAGSKGKGSVATMCACIAKESGYRTGLYTSPHILRWKERIALAGEQMPESILIAAAEEVIPLVDGAGPADFPGSELPTYFELTTLIAFCAFRLAGCAVQVIEVGLGGRLDSTNIVDPDISVITPIELEHTQYLGDTIAQIAGEKAGIIKQGKPVCISPQKDEAFAVFKKTAAERNSPFFSLPETIEIRNCQIGTGGTDCSLFPSEGSPLAVRSALTGQGVQVHSPMPGKVQSQNMALATLACIMTMPEVSREAIRKGLAAATLPARFELLRNDPLIIADGAHTPASVAATIETLESIVPGEKTLLFGCAIDKKYQELVSLLAHHFSSIIVTRPGSFKQSNPDEVFVAFRTLGAPAELIPDTQQAIVKAIAVASARRSMLLVTGSFYLCAEVKLLLGS